jgi:shikimate kinase
MTRRLLLVGMMGAGKTTVGRLVADRLSWHYADSDHEVESTAGQTVAELFARGGEREFRPLESAALAAAVAGDEPVVVSVAGGAVLDAANRAARVVSGSHRPLLGNDPAGALERLDAERRPLYEEVADAVVDVDDLDPEAVADRVVGALR